MTAGHASALFASTFGDAPRVVASAPGRVNLIGEHTDYNGGEVLPIAIDRRTWVAMGPSDGTVSRAISSTQEVAGTFDVRHANPSGAWWDYVHGSLRELASLGAEPVPLDIAVVSDVPPGAGLSSSAALEVATLLGGLVCVGASLMKGWEGLAAGAHRAETGFVGVSCGMMDQTASAYATDGHALRLWCDTGRREHVPFARTVLVIDTVSPRALRRSAFNERQASCARALAAIQVVDPSVRHLAQSTPEQLAAAVIDTTDRRRARHVIAESARVEAFTAALAAGLPLGTLLRASHDSLRTDYECSTPELDWVVDFAEAAEGVEGARLTGAGWGGCAIAVGSEEGLQALADAIAPAYEARWGRAPRTWLTRAEDGADIDEVEGLDPLDD
ncbi:MAG: galactokinase [Cytophagaceae bacterium]|nr:galactokinase [Gemmatimonadaceae bacterium]